MQPLTESCHPAGAREARPGVWCDLRVAGMGVATTEQGKDLRAGKETTEDGSDRATEITGGQERKDGG